MAAAILLTYSEAEVRLGLFDRVFKKGGSETPGDASAQAVKLKYQSVLLLVETERVRVLNLHVEGGRLYLKGAAPTEEARGRILDAIGKVTPADSADIVAEITVG